MKIDEFEMVQFRNKSFLLDILKAAKPILNTRHIEYYDTRYLEDTYRYLFIWSNIERNTTTQPTLDFEEKLSRQRYTVCYTKLYFDEIWYE